MELILMSLLTAITIIAGIFIGNKFGIDRGIDIGYEEGYKDGLKENKVTENFPSTLDGKFFSTEMAIKQMSKVGEDR